MAKSKQKLVDGGDYIIRSFRGLNTATKNPKLLADGQPQDSLNWITGWNPQTKIADNIQLRTGSALLHKTRLGAGKVNGLAVAETSKGVQIPFWAAGGNIYYFNSATSDYQLSGTLTATEDMSMQYCQDLFGPYIYAGSQNTGMNLIPVGNPTTIYQAAGTGLQMNIAGNFTIRQNYLFLWNYLNLVSKVTNQTTLLQSTADQSDVGTAITAGTISQVGASTGVSGNGVLTAFSGNVSSKASLVFGVQIGSPINSFAVSSIVATAGAGSLTFKVAFTGGDVFNNNDFVCLQGLSTHNLSLTPSGTKDVQDTMALVVSHSAGVAYLQFIDGINNFANNTYSESSGTISKVEFFTDDQNGALVSTLGSVGTINYVTGAWTINVQTAVPNGLNIDNLLYTGAPNTLDFVVATNRAQLWPQSGSYIEAVGVFNAAIYIFHQLSTWLLSAFTSATMNVFRQNMGAPFFRSQFEKSDGILFLDNSQQNNVKFRILQLTQFTNSVLPDSLSDDLDLSLNAFNYCKVHSVGNYDFLACQSVNQGTAQGYNDTCYVRNNISGFWDKTDFRISEMDVYNGTILAGDTISNNILQLFTGVDDDGAPITNHWTSGQFNLGFAGGKRFGFFYIDGFIGPSQVLNIYAQFDNGSYILIGSIYGNGQYVDPSNSVVIGQGLSGLNPIGGQGNGQVLGFHFQNAMPFWSPIFNYISISFVAGQNLQTSQPAYGGLQINEFGFKDCRIKSTKILPQYIGH